MRTKIIKWGNSLGLRIPRSFAQEVRVSEGSVVDLSLEDDHLVVRLVDRPHYTLKELLAGVTPDNLHGEIDTGHSVGDESW